MCLELCAILKAVSLQIFVGFASKAVPAHLAQRHGRIYGPNLRAVPHSGTKCANCVNSDGKVGTFPRAKCASVPDPPAQPAQLARWHIWFWNCAAVPNVSAQLAHWHICFF